VIMKWNRATFYAIAVGHLADRINGAAGLNVNPPKMPNLSRARVKELQTQLNVLCFDVGKPDGILGSKSLKGLQAFQKDKGLVADGYPSEATFKALAVK